MANPNAPQRLVERFLAVSEAAKIQSGPEVGLVNADINVRHACEITMEEVVLRNEVRDCRGQDLVDETLRTRGLRFTFNYEAVTPQILAMWAAYFFGSAVAPVGTQADEVQTLTVTASGTLSLTLEGRTVVTSLIPITPTAQQVQDALTAPRMRFIQPGDVVVTGSGPFTLTFPNTGRLRRANLPLLVGTGGMAIAAGTNGAQRFHALNRATANAKVRFSFCMGWENVTNRVEKYIGFICDSYTPNLTRRQNVSLSVSVVGPWAPELVTAFAIPACVNIAALITDDCKVQVQSLWETTDISTEQYTLNDNVPIDESSAYGFDSIDIQDLERGDQPSYDIQASIFASEADNIYTLALNERTQLPVDYRTHFGQPGNRFSLISTKTKIKFQNNRIAFAGTLNKSTVNIQGTPYKDGSIAPVTGEAYLDQATAFLVTSV